MKAILNQYLKRSSRLTEVEREEVLNSFQHKILKKNDFFVKSGDICNQIAFLQKGILRIHNEIEGEETTFSFVFENSFSTALTSLAYKQPSIWSIQALSKCELLIISREEHFRLIDKYRNWLEVDNTQLLLAYTSLENRMLKQIQKNAELRFNDLFSEQPEIFNLIQLKHIASYLGIKPETLSRLRRKHLK